MNPSKKLWRKKTPIQIPVCKIMEPKNYIDTSEYYIELDTDRRTINGIPVIGGIRKRIIERKIVTPSNDKYKYLLI